VRPREWTGRSSRRRPPATGGRLGSTIDPAGEFGHPKAGCATGVARGDATAVP
jgi:hypothetical protein